MSLQLLCVVFKLFFFIHSTVQDQSISRISSLGDEFIPADTSYPSLLTFTAKNRLYCFAECNKRIECRTFDYDADTNQCRLWDVDIITSGSIVFSPSKLQSSVGSIQLLPNIYTNMHNQSCDKCVLSRYEICNTNTNKCQCPSKTFWNGSICLAQLLYNQTCSSNVVCRSDLNLTCQPSCDFTYRCLHLPALGVSQTVAGFCNSTIGSSSTELSGPWSIYLSPNDGTLYVADFTLLRVLAYPSFSRTGYIIRSGFQTMFGIFVDNSDTIYMADRLQNGGTIYMQREGVDIGTIPPTGIDRSSCASTKVHHPSSIAIDRSNNAYITLSDCCAIIKWSLNYNNGTSIAGQAGNCGTTNNQFMTATSIYLDEDRNAFYVSERSGHRIQKFIINGNGTGITVAGNGTSGIGLNQLNSPIGFWVTRDGQTLYVADYLNNRVMKWIIGATEGSVVLGNVNGTAGNNNQMLFLPGSVVLDSSERYLYVADNGNHRVQRIRIK